MDSEIMFCTESLLTFAVECRALLKYSLLDMTDTPRSPVNKMNSKRHVYLKLTTL